jgi:hypothetical protein
MQEEGQADGPASGTAGRAAQVDAPLDAAFAAVEAALAGSPDNPVPVASPYTVAELLVRGLTSTDGVGGVSAPGWLVGYYRTE